MIDFDDFGTREIREKNYAIYGIFLLLKKEISFRLFLFTNYKEEGPFHEIVSAC